MKKPLGAAFVLLSIFYVYGHDMKINEVFITSPDNGKPGMVEIVNDGPKDTDISGWIIKDSNSNEYVFPDSTIVRPGGLVLVAFGAPPLDFAVAPETTILRCDKPWFNDLEYDECAVYSPGEKELVDYVQWGHWAYARRKGATPAYRQAVKQGLWPLDGLIQTWFAYGNSLNCSIGRIQLEVEGCFNQKMVKRGDWLLFKPDETSFGRNNELPKPIIFSHYRVAVSGSGFDISLLDGLRECDGTYRFQAGKEKDFSEIYFETASSELFNGGQSWPPGIYFGRVREESPRRAGRWSATGTLVIKSRPRDDPEKSESEETGME
ncbi:MAG: lamin tail domain-containing protein [Victivallaceae bacterium]|nr:lamin tail domain-containing protein [Victivallaceae bacterium]